MARAGVRIEGVPSLARRTVALVIGAAGGLGGWWVGPWGLAAAEAQRIGWGGVAPQGENPVFIADSPAAAEALLRVGDHVRSGNLDQAVALVQQLLDDEPWSLVPIGDGAVYVSVRSRVGAVLLETPALLGRYRLLQEARAQQMLEAGDLEGLVRSRWLTGPGLEGLLRQAQRRLEAGRFLAAWTALGEVSAHPDCVGGRAGAALELARLLERYSGGSGARRVVAELAARAGVEAGEPEEVVAPPASAVLDWVSGLTGAGGGAAAGGVVDLSTVVPRPLASALHDGATGAGAVGGGGGGGGGMPRGMGVAEEVGAGGSSLPEGQRMLRTFASLVGEVLVVGGGNALLGLDRYTLSVRWRYEAEASRRSAARATRWDVGTQFPLMENVLSVSAAPGGEGAGRGGAGVVVAVVSAEGLSGEGLQRLVALDAQTGQPRWSRVVPQLSPELGASVVRGPVLVGEGTVVLSLRRAAGDRRMTGAVLAGVDLATGDLRWVRLLGSAGALPYYSQPSRVSDAALLDGGVVYRSDRVGVVGAYAVEDGRPLWVRRLAAEPLEFRSSATAPFQMAWPVVIGEHLFVLTPDRTKLLRLDRATGAETGQLAADRLMNPVYLVAAGDRLAAVGDSRLVVFEAGARLDESLRVEVSPTLPPPGVRGRVVAARQRSGAAPGGAASAGGGADGAEWVLLVPSPGQVRVVRVAQPEAEPRVVRLDSSGNVLAAGDQLLVTDDLRVHSYLSWEGADRVLTARMAQEEDDPTAAATLAEIAARSGRPARVIEASARAAEQVARARGADKPAIVDRAEQQRRRLMNTLVSVVRRALVEEADAGAGVGARGGAGPAGDASGAEVAAMLERIGELARGPEELAVHRLLAGRQSERAGRWEEAVAGYQSVIEDPGLALASTAGVFASGRAGDEAGARIEAVLAARGRGVYAAFDARADGLLAAMTAPTAATPATAGALVELARTYPGWVRGPGVYLRAAGLMTEPGQARARSRVLEQGLQAARRIADADRATVAELGGQLVESFRQRGLGVAARQTASRLAQRYPGMVLTSGGGVVDLSAAAGSRAGAAGVVYPAAGAPRAAGQQLLERAMLVEPALPGPEGPAGGGARGYAVVQDAWGGLAMLAPGAGDPGAPLRRVWQSPASPDPVRLLRADAECAIVATLTEGAVRLTRINADGSVAWESAGLPRDGAPAGDGKDGAPADRAGQRPAIAGDPGGLPMLTLDGLAERGEVLVAGDESTLALVERSGRFVLVDVQTGETLGGGRSPVGRVSDAGLLGETLVIGGELAPEGLAGGVGGGVRGVLSLVEARTGRLGRTVELALPPGAPGADAALGERAGAGGGGGGEVPGLTLAAVRWLRLTERGEVLVAWQGGLSAVDPQSGVVDWTLPAGSTAAATGVDAWLIEGRLVVLGGDRSLWLLEIDGGKPTPVSMDTAGRIGAGDEVWVGPLPGAVPAGGGAGGTGGAGGAGGGFVLRTTRGVAVYSGAGQLIAADGLGGGSGGPSVIMPAMAEGSVLVLSRQPTGARAGGVVGGDGAPDGAGAAEGGGGAGGGVYALHEVSTATGVIRRSTAISLPRAPSRVAVLPGRVLITVGRSTVVLAAPATP